MIVTNSRAILILRQLNLIAVDRAKISQINGQLNSAC